MKRYKLAIFFIVIVILIVIPKYVDAMTIVLDPGHGGIDVGSISTDKTLYEKDANLKIAQYLRDFLQKYENVEVILTHEGFSEGEISVYDRAMVAREKNADLLVCLHNNSGGNGNTKGAEVYVTANKSLPKYNSEMTSLGNKVLNNLVQLGIENRGVRIRLIEKDKTDIYSDGSIADYYGIIRYAMRGTKIDNGIVKPEGKTSACIEKGEGISTILIEHCYINNSSDVQYLKNEEKIQQIAEADGMSIVEQYGLIPKKIEYKLGDCNGDGEINSGDLLLVRKHLIGKTVITNEKQLKSMDINADNEINSGDLLLIRKHLIGKYTIVQETKEEVKKNETKDEIENTEEVKKETDGNGEKDEENNKDSNVN